MRSGIAQLLTISAYKDIALYRATIAEYCHVRAGVDIGHFTAQHDLDAKT